MLVNRGPLSVLVHPNAGDVYRDHTQRAFWLGAPWPLNTKVLLKAGKEKEKEASEKATK
jgi:aromatic ring-cleaving dioxygenase